MNILLKIDKLPVAKRERKALIIYLVANNAEKEAILSLYTMKSNLKDWL
jgi:hypothetical protein